MKLKLPLFIFFLIAICYNSVAQTKEQIDSLLLRTHYLNQQEGDMKGAVDLAFDVVEKSRKINYEYGIENGLYVIAVLLSDSRDFEKSIEYIEQAKQFKDFLNKNPGSAFNLLILQASNNDELGFASMAASCFQEAASVVFTDKEFKNKKYYQMLLHMRSDLAYDNRDSQYARYLLAKEIIEQPDRNFSQDFPRTELLVKRAELYDKIGTIHLDKGNLDSARYYYKKMTEVADEMQSEFLQALSLARTAILYEHSTGYDTALKLLTQSEYLLKHKAIFSNLKQIYDTKSRIYAKLGQTDQEKEYLNLSLRLADSLSTIKNKGRDKTLASLVAEKEAELGRMSKLQNYMTICYALLSLAGLSLGYFIFSKYKRNKELRLLKQQQLLEKVQEELGRVKEESQQLQQAVQNSKEGILVLARENHPDFWPKFRELYPSFRDNLLAVNPDLKITELIFCAYIYLGFSTREIAEYTFKATKTVENNRYNLRKRLGLNAETDLVQFINSTIL